MDGKLVYPFDDGSREMRELLVKTWWRSGLETLAVGGRAATLAYGAGVALQGVA